MKKTISFADLPEFQIEINGGGISIVGENTGICDVSWREILNHVLENYPYERWNEISSYRSLGIRKRGMERRGGASLSKRIYDKGTV